MGGTAGCLDGMLETAWRDFRQAFADALEALDPGDVVQVELDPGDGLDDGVPYVQALRDGANIVLEASSNRFLATRHKLSRRGLGQLRALGLTAPSTSAPNYWAAYPRSHVDQAASVAVSALREAFGVIHPAFLASDDLQWASGRAAHVSSPSVTAAVVPVNREHLDRLIDLALTPMLGHAPRRDDDGDVPLRAGTAVLFVRNQWPAPTVRVFAEMTVDVTDLDAAVRELDVLNREIGAVTFALHGRSVVASADLIAAPFVGEQLRTLVVYVCEVVSRNDGLLAKRVGGRVFLDGSTSAAECVVDDDVTGGEGAAADVGGSEDDGAAEHGIHPVMMCMLQLDAERPGSVGPAAAAKLCGYDSDLLLELIRWNEEQEIAWRQARDEAYAADEEDQAEVCEIERAHASRTISVLRKALRRVLLG